MIQIEKTEVMGWEQAIRGMRNPMNSWEKSDSGFYCGDFKCSKMDGCDLACDIPHYVVGPNDYDLMRRLAQGGPVHAKYRRMIVVYADITAPLYWWKEFDTYKVGTVANSCSTMHKIQAKKFTQEDFSCEHLSMDTKDSIGWIRGVDPVTPLGILNITVSALNVYRDRYLETKDKKYWWQMIQLLPSSYNQKRTVMINYEVLASIYPMRKNHKLDEWHEFCDWIKSLPYSELIIGETKDMRVFDEWIKIVPGCQMPDEGVEVLITIEQDESYGEGTKITYEVDIGEYRKDWGYLPSANANGFFDIVNDWGEGQPIRVVAWMKKPIAYRTEDNYNGKQ